MTSTMTRLINVSTILVVLAILVALVPTPTHAASSVAQCPAGMSILTWNTQSIIAERQYQGSLDGFPVSVPFLVNQVSPSNPVCVHATWYVAWIDVTVGDYTATVYPRYGKALGL